MKKKLLSFALSLVLVLSLTACRDSATTASDSGAQESAALSSMEASTGESAVSSSASQAAQTDPSAAGGSSENNSQSTQESTPTAAGESAAASAGAVNSADLTNATNASDMTGSSNMANVTAAGNGLGAGGSAASTDNQLTIALFGLDANKNPSGDDPESWAKLMRQFRSDCTMIANINMDTGEVKLVSVYRDTFLNTGDDKYQKCNAAYARGGATQAVEMLNTNLDLNIDKYIAVSYHSLMDLIDGLGGITIDVEKAALNEINGYQNTIVTDLGLSGYTPVTESGSQTLNGLQATAYCRLRHDFPRGDLDRAAHQRKVLKAIEEKAKQTDAVTLAALFTKVFAKIHTNLDMETLADLVANIDNYSIAGEAGFPADDMVKIATLGKSGSCVVPIDLESNVIRLHQFLYDQENYTPSQTVKDINATIIEKASPYVSFD
ncbi:MAG: LCP family protein [Butyrivibrio sp.]|nr:LCP family protein [Muribaculum sp.]MCM1551200.1 LCP family protein [Butyrivibrio sp.]